MLVCPVCRIEVRATASFCGKCGSAVGPLPSALYPKKYVTISPNGEILINVRDVSEAKPALKELKLMKREVANAKRLIMENKRQIRASYTDKVRSRFGLFGKHGTGGWIRDYQKAERNSSRRRLAKDLDPYEAEQQKLEAQVIALNRAILEVEAYILQNPESRKAKERSYF